MKKVIVVAPALSFSGYGEHARFILRSLKTIEENIDLYLKNIPWGATSYIVDDSEERTWIDHLISKTIQYENSENVEPYDVSMQITIPGEWNANLAVTNIGITAGTESNKISPQWFMKSREMDKIIVVSEHSKSSFVNAEFRTAFQERQDKVFMAKINSPVEVIGFPYKNIEPSKVNLELEHDFNFLAVGTFIPRKNIENTIRWFVSEFRDKEVGIVLKTSMGKNSLLDRRTTLKRIKNIIGDNNKDMKCKIYFLHGNMTEEEMAGLYNHPKIKGLINLSHGEGFGLPIFEAACNALPIITINWGGQVDYLNMEIKDKKTSKKRKRPMFVPISYDLRPIQPEAVWGDILIKESMWAFPKEWSFRKGLNAFMKNYSTYENLAKKLQAHIQKEFAFQSMSEKFLKISGLEETTQEESSETVTL